MVDRIVDAADALRFLPDLLVPEADAGQRRAASLVLAGRAGTADELADWLRMCGLLPAPPRPVPDPAAAPIGRARSRPVVSEDRPTGPRLDTHGQVARCRNGHAMTASNTRWTGNGGGRWQGRCKTCETLRGGR